MNTSVVHTSIITVTNAAHTNIIMSTIMSIMT